MKVHILQTGYTKVPYGQFFGGLQGWTGLKGLIKFATDKSHFIVVPINSFLIEHPTQGLILVDTGINWEQTHEHSKYYTGAAKLILDEDEYLLKEEEQLPTQLNNLGFQCKDVKTIILTHLHEDHVGGLRYFPNAQVIISKAEWDIRNNKILGLIPLGYPKSLEPVKDWRIIPYSSGPFYNFDKSEDVFGDGSLVLIPTPGHSFGHLSIYVQCNGYQLLLCGDGLYTLRHLAVEQVRSISLKKAWMEEYIKSAKQIVNLRKLIPNLVIVPGHDPTEYYTNYLKPFFQDGILSKEELEQIQDFEKRVFTSDYTLVEEYLPQFIPSPDGGKVGTVK